jgi:hypothetical protein
MTKVRDRFKGGIPNANASSPSRRVGIGFAGLCVCAIAVDTIQIAHWSAAGKRAAKQKQQPL